MKDRTQEGLRDAIESYRGSKGGSRVARINPGGIAVPVEGASIALERGATLPFVGYSCNGDTRGA
jgi:hypothetical protein